ncbi:MAG: protein kinase [Sedimentisphaerales bacterium]|nr:protein kinase [Sedimentisphaerales bacterium]
MAVVYMAEQEEPIRRKVALKIIKLGMDTRQVIARFEAERQALAMMDHPNIAKVFDAGATETGRPYFVMELVQGVSITEYCDQDNLSTKERLALFLQVCNAVQHAHQKGIIHRDIKPSNVMVAHHDGKSVPKVIDFGIAKATNQRLTEKTLFTRYAHIIGTPAYMSPEQAGLSDLDIDTRTDIYSLGVLLYELLTGTIPFSEEKLRKAGYLEMQRIIREQEPAKPSTKLTTLGATLTDVAKHRGCTADLLRKAIRGDLDWIVMKALEKARERRYDNASALAMDIERHLKNEPILAGSLGILYHLQKFVRRYRSRIAMAVVVTVLAVGLVITAVKYRHTLRLEWAKGEALPRLEELVKAGDYHTAFPLARQARKIIPRDPVLQDLWPRISKTYSITTTPAGAEVFYRKYSDQDAPWHYLGRCPLEDIILANSIYHWKFEKQGFIPHECVTDRSLSVQLCPSDLGREMVWVEGWQAVLPGDSHAPGTAFTATTPFLRISAERPRDAHVQSATVEVPAFLMDKYEITNEQFQTFVNAGGYTNADYWEGLDFIEYGRRLSWQEAMARFRDQTDQPGPATWEDGTYPQGQERYPVSGVSWFEAMAYARFSGSSLPTVHHWQKAACLEESSSIVPHSNFAVGGTAVVGSFPGMGHTGLCDMAGNVKEWCFNATDDSGGERYILGGSYGEQMYQFFAQDFRSPWNRSRVNGFRCVKYSEGIRSFADGFLAPVPLPKTRDYTTSEPCSDEEYRFILRRFEYDRLPLDWEVESVDDSAPFWREETITFNAAYERERVIAHLFLPKDVVPPYQVVVYFPDNTALEQRPFTGLEQRGFTEMVLLSGRALMFPIYQGTYERSFGRMLNWYVEPHATTDWIIHVCKDVRRSIDYLETRPDIDKDRIAYYGVDNGGGCGPMVLAVEDRFQAGILVTGGFFTNRVTATTRAIDPMHHAPRVKVPVLMINGKDDYAAPYETSQRPMYEFLGTPEAFKEHKPYPCGHGVLSLFSNQVHQDVVDWLDRYLGPVQ